MADMMKPVRVGVSLLLLAVVVLLSASSCTQQQVNETLTLAEADIPCVADVAYSLFTLVKTHRIPGEQILNGSIDCVSAGFKTYLVLKSDAAPDTPQTDVQYKKLSGGAIEEDHFLPINTTSNMVANCDPTQPLPVTVSFTVPFKMFISSNPKGTISGERATFTQPDVEGLDRQAVSASLGDQQIIAQKLFRDGKDWLNLTPGDTPSGTIDLSGPNAIPPRMKEAFALTLDITYRSGGALVTRNGMHGMPFAWLYDDRVQVTKITPTLPLPVTPLDCI
jgi:hypothetical protein